MIDFIHAFQFRFLLGCDTGRDICDETVFVGLG
jgi:hypothetical protein